MTRGAVVLWAATCAAVVTASLAVGRILFLFSFITVGPETVRVLPSRHPFWFFSIPEVPFLVALLGAVPVVFFTRRALALRSASSAVLVVWCSVLTVLLMHSYRFSALLAAFFVVVCVVRRWRVGGRVTLSVATALCLLPADVTLQVHPVSPRFVPAYYGGLTVTPPPADGYVWVGGCQDVYAPPREFWMW